MKGANLDLSREFNPWTGLAAHIEYNGDVTTGHYPEYGSQFQHVMLIGLAYNMHSQDYRRILGGRAMYKQYFKGQSHKAHPGFQLIAAWTILAVKWTMK